MICVKEFYLFPEDVYRMGNSTSHRMAVIRQDGIAHHRLIIEAASGGRCPPYKY